MARVPGAAARSAEPGSVLRAAQSRRLVRRADQEGSALLFQQLRVHQPGRRRGVSARTWRRRAASAGTFPNPYRGHLFSTASTGRSNTNHTAFVRFSHDQNNGFGPSGSAVLPSNWLRNTNKSDQTVLGLTSHSDVGGRERLPFQLHVLEEPQPLRRSGDLRRLRRPRISRSSTSMARTSPWATPRTRRRAAICTATHSSTR